MKRAETCQSNVSIKKWRWGFKCYFYLYFDNQVLNPFKALFQIRCKPLDAITLEQIIFDYKNLMVTIMINKCDLWPVTTDNNKQLISLNRDHKKRLSQLLLDIGSKHFSLISQCVIILCKLKLSFPYYLRWQI